MGLQKTYLEGVDYIYIVLVVLFSFCSELKIIHDMFEVLQCGPGEQSSRTANICVKTLASVAVHYTMLLSKATATRPRDLDPSIARETRYNLPKGLKR